MPTSAVATTSAAMTASAAVAAAAASTVITAATAAAAAVAASSAAIPTKVAAATRTVTTGIAATPSAIPTEVTTASSAVRSAVTTAARSGVAVSAVVPGTCAAVALRTVRAVGAGGAVAASIAATAWNYDPFAQIQLRSGATARGGRWPIVTRAPHAAAVVKRAAARLVPGEAATTRIGIVRSPLIAAERLVCRASFIAKASSRISEA